MPGPETTGRDLDLLIEAAKTAGDIAMRHWRNSPKVWEKPDGQGPVSEADLEVNDALHHLLRAARPTYGWLSEETEDTAERLATQTQFILDPIDGTRSFVKGDTSFSHALAVVQGGQVLAGVVYLPAQNKLYAATSDGPATLNGREIRVREGSVPLHILTGKASLAPELWPGGVPDVQRHFRASMAWRLCLVAEGAFDALLTLRPAWEWDIAAGTLIAVRAGALVSDRSGGEVRFNFPDPRSAGLVVAHPTQHVDLIRRLTTKTN